MLFRYECEEFHIRFIHLVFYVNITCIKPNAAFHRHNPPWTAGNDADTTTTRFAEAPEVGTSHGVVSGANA